MKICGQEFSEEIRLRIQQVIDANPEMSQTKLSRIVCQWLNWKSPNGKLKEMSCRVALRRLEKRGLVRLPAGRRKREIPSKEYDEILSIDKLSVECGLRDIGKIEIIRISGKDKAESRIWRGMMEKYHYLGSGPLCGAQIRYLIKSGKYGYVGGFSFSGAAWRIRPRDEWIRWNDETRESNLHLVVSNSRFLIIPGVRVKNLASHALSLVVKRLREDWMEQYGYSPVLIETFVECGRFSGTSYRAANWEHIGKTSGRGRQDRTNKRAVPVKDIYIYELTKDSRERLCPAGELLQKQTAEREQKYADWAEEEFKASIERVKKEKIAFAVQDSTSFNYSAHPMTEGLGPIGSKKEGGPIGIIMHDTMAFTEDGTPLGLIDIQCWSRDREEFGKKHNRHNIPIEEKESRKWLVSYQKTIEAQKLCPETMIVSMGDREADIYDLFELANKEKDNPKLLVRASQDRPLKEDEYLWDAISKNETSGIQEVHVPRKKGRTERTARLSVKYSAATP